MVKKLTLCVRFQEKTGMWHNYKGRRMEGIPRKSLLLIGPKYSGVPFTLE